VIKEKIRDGLPEHLDSDNSEVQVPKDTLALLDSEAKPVVAANAYLGAREIVKALEVGADIIIAGRVADASPVSFQRTDHLKERTLADASSGDCSSLVLVLVVRNRL